jgi:hypothetical protein
VVVVGLVVAGDAELPREAEHIVQDEEAEAEAEAEVA